MLGGTLATTSALGLPVTATPDDELAAPAVAADVYDEDYYRTCCLGAEHWESSGGREASGIYSWILDLAGFAPGMTVVDVGCGRGELVAVAAKRGAGRAIGLDYSASAIELATVTLEVNEVADVASVHHVDARRSPVEAGSADIVTMVDVVEHLSDTELADALGEAIRMLRPGGLLLAHTMPNRWIYDVTYRSLRRAARVAGRDWPEDPRNDYERLMHVNEQSPASLWRHFRSAGFTRVRASLGDVVHADVLPSARARALMRRSARLPVVRWLAAADFLVTGRRPASPR